MSGSLHAMESADPNLTPILDMVFQLITFFMLVVSFKASDFDQSLNLPVVGAAAPVQEDTDVEYFVLNLRPGEKLVVQGKEEPNIEGYIAMESNFRKSVLVSRGEAKVITVVVRADKSLRTDFLMRAINACKANGLERFDFMVLSGGQP